MTIRRCDRCGKDYVRYADYGVRFGTWSHVSSALETMSDPKGSTTSYDLCENCAYAFMRWFNRPSYRKGVCIAKKKNGQFKFELEIEEETT